MGPMMISSDEESRRSDKGKKTQQVKPVDSKSSGGSELVLQKPSSAENLFAELENPPPAHQKKKEDKGKRTAKS